MEEIKMFASTITLGNLIEIVVIAAGGYAFMIKIDQRVRNLEKIYEAASIELKRVAEILIVLARYEERFLNQEKRAERQDKLIDDLRRGRGKIVD